jgi:YD repeat-containing protein
MLRRILALVIGTGLLAPTIARANVSLRNGNFFIGYTDAVYSGGFELSVERVYNSKSPFKGLFGVGWGMEYEMYVQPTGDGSVIVHEYGGGAENLFVPAEPDAAMLAVVTQSIMRAALRARDIPASDTLSFKKRLSSDAIFRNDEWTKYVKSGDVLPRRLPAGTQLRSDRFAKQILTRTATGYSRALENGRVELYDDAGHLVRISDSNNNSIDLAYDAAGHLSTIKDNAGHTLRFTQNARGLITSVRMDNGRTAAYRYNERDDLVWTRDVDGNVYTHTYDARHNMTQIGYQDGTAMRITYHPLTLHENVKSVKDRDGTLTTYDYRTLRADPLILRITVSTFASAQGNGSGAKVSESVYEYHMFANDEFGREAIEREIVTIDGDREETIRNRCCGLPILIVSGNDSTRFAYDNDGHVIYKESTSSIDSLAYSASIAKVTRVVHFDKESQSRSWTEFAYDSRGNLVSAHDSNDESVKLTYDSNGRIAKMEDKDGVISFVYNKDSKPIEIKHSTLGSIVVTYDSSGEVDKVDSPGGREVAVKVTQAFVRLQALIKPAGVTLGL